MYHTIRTQAYEPNPDHGPWQETLHVLRLGDELHETFNLRLAGTDGAIRPQGLPVRRLNLLLHAMAPGVLAIGCRAGHDGRLPWLYARETVPRKVLGPLIGTWAAGLFRDDEEDEEYAEGPDGEPLTDDAWLTEHLPVWETERVDFTESVPAPGGTAELPRRLYSLLPERIAFQLAAQPFRIGGTCLRFRVVSAPSGAELVSWPPQRYERRKQTWYYSACVSITVHTVPFAPRFRVHVSTRVRRWATRLDVRPWQLGGTTVLLDAPLPWPEGPDRGHRLMPNALAYDRRRKELVWRRHSPAPLLPELDLVRSYPEPMELFTRPDTWVNGRGGVSAGIVYHPVLGQHEVGPGLMPRERSELDAWVEEGLRPLLRRVDDLVRVTRSNTPSLLPRSAAKAGTDAKEAQKALRRQTALADALGGRSLEVEILWQTPETRDALLRELPELLGLPPGSRVRPDDDVWEWRNDTLVITARARPAGPLAGTLRIPRDPKRRMAARLAEAITERCAFVATRTSGPRSGIGIVIAEIADKSQFAAVPGGDPKYALRLAWARQGWLSQFVNLPVLSGGAVRHRARSAWLDALRQLGAISPPAHRVGAGVPVDLQFAALWLVRYTRKGPTRCPTRRLVAVRVRPAGGSYVVEGWDGERAEWVPYPVLLRLLASSADAVAEATPAGDVERQIRTLLFQFRVRPTLLLVDAGNMRQCWPRLRNGSLARDMVGFGTHPDQRLTVYGQDLRVVLVRDDNNRGEVAQWYAHDPDGNIGFAEGVWGTAEPDNRVFASTAAVPHTVAGLPRGLMKLVPTAECRTAPGKAAWNPGQLEVTVLACLSEKALADVRHEGQRADIPAEWATLVHQLRYHDDYLPLDRPLPMHLARLAGEYVLPLAVGLRPAPPTCSR